MNIRKLSSSTQLNLYLRLVDDSLEAECLNENQLDALQNLVKNWSASKLFKEYCEWHGLIGWATNLEDVLNQLKIAEKG